jgi:hypothetical protein
MSRRLAIVCAGLGVGLGAGAFALAQGTPRTHVLHEDLEAPPTDPDSPLLGGEPADGHNPAAFASGDKVLPEPSSQPPKDAPVLGRGGSPPIATPRPAPTTTPAPIRACVTSACSTPTSCRSSG